MSNPDLSPAAVLEAALADVLLLAEADQVLLEHSDDTISFDSVRSYEDAGVLTTDRGLVVRLSNGQEFQITIVRSR